MASKKKPVPENEIVPTTRHDLIIGVDPGVQGGICCMLPGGEVVAVHKLPVTAVEMRDVLEEYGTKYQSAILFVELVQPHGRFLSNMHKLMRCSGVIEGVAICLRFAYKEVTPTSWQRKHNCLTKGDKNVSKAKAMELFPKHKITHQSADAMLIAEYGRLLLASGQA